MSQHLLTNDQIEQFNRQHESPQAVVRLEPGEQQRWLQYLLDEVLRPDDLSSSALPALTAVKILSRNQKAVNNVVKAENLNTLLRLAGLEAESRVVRQDLQHVDVILEALRCLSNMYLQSSVAVDLGLANNTIPEVMEQTKLYSGSRLPLPVISFDMKLLFLITAHRPEARNLILKQGDGVQQLVQVLQLMLDRAASGDGHETVVVSCCLSGDQVMVVNDTLKLLFNLTVGLDEQKNQLDEQRLMTQVRHLLHTLHALLVMPTQPATGKQQVVSNCINLLTNVPAAYLQMLTEQPDCGKETAPDSPEPDMKAIDEILLFLSQSLDQQKDDEAKADPLRIRLSPVLKVLSCCAKSCSPLRRHLRAAILPPLHEADVRSRPEEGTTLRNKLCRLLTHPDVSISLMTAELLFVLCKENVGRFVKHTGFGNAAGLLARRGLLMGGNQTNTEYSDSDQEDSDTEDYLQAAHLVNPMTGCIDHEPNQPHPMAGMSNEQKEYEAMQLVQLIHKLNNLGVIQPAKLDSSGKPVPVESVLQLIEDANGRNQEHDSDEEEN